MHASSLSVLKQGFPDGSMVKNPSASAGDMGSSLGWEYPLGRKWQSIPIFLPGKYHGGRSLVGRAHEAETELEMTYD